MHPEEGYEAECHGRPRRVVVVSRGGRYSPRINRRPVRYSAFASIGREGWSMTVCCGSHVRHELSDDIAVETS